jgi:hypothetical protein
MLQAASHPRVCPTLTTFDPIAGIYETLRKNSQCQWRSSQLRSFALSNTDEAQTALFKDPVRTAL